MEESIEAFRVCLSRFLDGTPEGMEQSRQEIFHLRANNWSLLIFLATAVGKDPDTPAYALYLCFSALKDALSPSKLRPLTVLARLWRNLPSGVDTRSELKALLLSNIEHPDERICNMVAVLIALVRRIDGKEWDAIFPIVIGRSPPLPAPTIVNIFEELLRLRCIARSVSDDIKECLTGFVCIISSVLQSPQTPSFGKLRCAHCLRLLLRCVPSLFNDEPSITRLFQLLESVLPHANIHVYREVHWILLELVKVHHSIADLFIAEVFRVTAIGLECADFEFRLCSLHFWAKVWEFEDQLLTDSAVPTTIPVLTRQAVVPLTLSQRGEQ